MTSFAVLVAWSVPLLVAHILLPSWFSVREHGLAWHASARDRKKRPQSRLAGRAERTSHNFRETYPAFVALGLALAVANPASVLGYYGAIIWFLARIAYVPLYLLGVTYVRSLAWVAAMLGLSMMFLAVVM